MQIILIYTIAIMIFLIFLVAFLMLIFWKRIMKGMVQKVGKIIMTDSYQENIMEILPGLRHMGIQNWLENSLRGESGDVLHRPLGSSKKWPHLDAITFIPAQTTPFAVSGEEEVDISVTIGPKAKKPMKIKIPLMISGMAYGIALSEKVRLSLAEAAKKMGTAINSGEGGILPEELDAAENYIVQFSKTEWSKDEHLFKRANAIEIKLGQGATLAMGTKISPENLTGRAREVMELKENEDATIHEHFFNEQTIADLKELVDELRKISGGVPIGAKIGAGGRIEEDIDHLIEMGVDFIAIDGGQAASLGAPPILADDMGIPTLHAIVRASNHLEKRQMKGQISLIASGGLLVPGHFLKVLALGADAVYLGSAVLFAVSHSQSLKPLPFEPPTQVVWNKGKFKDQFDQEKGAKATEKFLIASTEEMKMALRAMSKRSLKELSRKDLVSYDELTARMIGIPYSFQPIENSKETQ
ncbi:FMN-binding glutamate synthase family protein [Bacillus sp. S/N-304-OC-R1]|uniref:FMN-binding glutamate synthase family protein n=1 Tax=Bacillus sp. S/N-304-OC-R1 TaxID=2758034 RepID=UPI001C8E9FAE|nr:FMN-binding glutamate synthase family protein [Bacillus sp. S/N-304-OC-R1]MBY0120969.1 FMN-binding glutamate synthase family protein [Bacillus sp. S/N-304-OC-R1]